MRYVAQLFQTSVQQMLRLNGLLEFLRQLPGSLFLFLNRIKNIGVTADMNAFEKSKLGIFNQLNFFQCITSIVIPVFGLFRADKFPVSGWFMASLPALVSIVVLILNSHYRHRAGLLTYFIFYPLFICFSYINGISLGVELSFILYGILSVFFIQDIGYMVFSISFSMISYFVLSVIWKTYPYQLEHINFVAYLTNQALAIIFIFYGLYFIKTENSNYNSALQKQSEQLQQQAEEMNHLNSVKNKLFSIISHDLKAPMYALRNLFDNMHKQDMPAEEIKAILPDVNKDLNYTVILMENLLQWARNQMQAESAMPSSIQINELIEEVMQTLHLQAHAKNIIIESRAQKPVHAWADRNMINLVLRNLISNAIKFTPPGGIIVIGASQHHSFAELYVQDSGKGINAEELKKINSHEFYTTTGTAQEQGTGLGLILCKEFLTKNGGRLRIDGEEGKGSTFSFTLPVG